MFRSEARKIRHRYKISFIVAVLLVAGIGLIFNRAEFTAIDHATPTAVKAVPVDVARIVSRNQEFARERRRSSESAKKNLAPPAKKPDHLENRHSARMAPNEPRPNLPKQIAQTPSAKADEGDTTTATATVNQPVVSAMGMSHRAALSQVLSQWRAQPVPAAELAETRQKIARGERLFVRTIIKNPDPFGDVRGGSRQITQ